MSQDSSSPYDAVAKRGEDEPIFALLARDPIAPSLIEAWAYLRSGQIAAAQIAFKSCLDAAAHIEAQAPGDPQIVSAFRVASEARDWHLERLVSGKR